MQRIWLKNPDPPEVHVFPHWNWDTSSTNADDLSSSNLPNHLDPCTGLCNPASGDTPANVTVFAFSNANGTVDLLLNNVSLGQQVIEKYGFLTWTVPYSPGTLEARAYSSESTTLVASKAVATTGPAAALKCSIKDGVGSEGIAARGTGVALVQVEIVDANGRFVPTAANIVEFNISGEGAEIIGTGNGNPASHTPDKAQTREAFRGLVLAVVQSTADSKSGTSATISASSIGLTGSSIVIELLPAKLPAAAYPRI
eukprot:COSAG02_NODE_7499_length_2984_cov_4.055113_3_plen_256_part_00